VFEEDFINEGSEMMKGRMTVLYALLKVKANAFRPPELCEGLKDCCVLLFAESFVA
jgi:hypothetical protein